MELTDLAIIALMVAIPTVLIFIRGKKGSKSRKLSPHEQLISVHQDTIDRLQVELRKQVGRANRYKQMLEGDTDELSDDIPQIASGEQVTFEQIQGLMQQVAPQYVKFLSLPFVKDKVMDITEGMSLNDVVGQLQSLKNATGQTSRDQQPIGGNSQSLQNNPTFA